jgi:hypothetical protein
MHTPQSHDIRIYAVSSYIGIGISMYRVPDYAYTNISMSLYPYIQLVVVDIRDIDIDTLSIHIDGPAPV